MFRPFPLAAIRPLAKGAPIRLDPAIRPVGRRKVSDEVRDALLAWIRSDAVESGERLPPERDLAARFEVSRATLRDAVRSLELLGYLEVRQGDGTVVRKPPTGARMARPFQSLLRGQSLPLRDLVELRRMLEPDLAELAAGRRVRADVTALRAALTAQRERVATGGDLVDLDGDFHALIARIAGNGTVIHILDTLQHLLREFRQRWLTADRPDLALDQHARIVDAIARGDGAAARAAMGEHLRSVEASIATLGAPPDAPDASDAPDPPDPSSASSDRKGDPA